MKKTLAICALFALVHTSTHTGTNGLDFGRRFGANSHIANMPLYYKHRVHPPVYRGPHARKNKQMRKQALRNGSMNEDNGMLSRKNKNKLARVENLKMRKRHAELELQKAQIEKELATLSSAS